VIVNLSEAAGDTMLDSLGTMMDGGAIELLTSDGNLLATLRLSTPAAKKAEGSELEFNKIAEGDAVAAGRATTARIIAADGAELVAVDVGDETSDAVVRLGTVQISRGAPVRLNSFKLAMP
jgi:hypothetical protein